MLPTRHLLATVVFSVFACSLATAQETGLPGNATSLREGHGDWTISCTAPATPTGDKSKRCVLSQQQVAQQTKQRALAIELTVDGKGVKGTLLLPFGLSLDKGVAFQLDEDEPGAPQRFRTCLPVGCVLDIAFDARTLTSLKSGKALKVKVIADGGQETVFSISLTGFSSAYDRITTLQRP